MFRINADIPRLFPLTFCTMFTQIFFISPIYRCKQLIRKLMSVPVDQFAKKTQPVNMPAVNGLKSFAVDHMIACFIKGYDTKSYVHGICHCTLSDIRLLLLKLPLFFVGLFAYFSFSVRQIGINIPFKQFAPRTGISVFSHYLSPQLINLSFYRTEIHY